MMAYDIAACILRTSPWSVYPFASLFTSALPFLSMHKAAVDPAYVRVTGRACTWHAMGFLPTIPCSDWATQSRARTWSGRAQC
jgi:hypothetical protein